MARQFQIFLFSSSILTVGSWLILFLFYTSLAQICPSLFFNLNDGQKQPIFYIPHFLNDFIFYYFPFILFNAFLLSLFVKESWKKIFQITILLFTIIIGIALISGIWGYLSGASLKTANAFRTEINFCPTPYTFWAVNFSEIGMQVGMFLASIFLIFRYIAYRETIFESQRSHQQSTKIIDIIERIFFGKIHRLDASKITEKEYRKYKENPKLLEMITHKDNVYGRLLFSIFIFALLLVFSSKIIALLIPDISTGDITGKFTWHLTFNFLKDFTFEIGVAMWGAVATVFLLDTLKKQREKEARQYKSEILKRIHSEKQP